MVLCFSCYTKGMATQPLCCTQQYRWEAHCTSTLHTATPQNEAMCRTLRSVTMLAFPSQALDLVHTQSSSKAGTLLNFWDSACAQWVEYTLYQCFWAKAMQPRSADKSQLGFSLCMILDKSLSLCSGSVPICKMGLMLFFFSPHCLLRLQTQLSPTPSSISVRTAGAIRI